MKRSCLFAGGILLLFLAACGPSSEQVATMTASAWTATPPPPTETPTPTPVPYNLSVKVVDAAGIPIAGASLVFPESGNPEPVIADDAGQFAWNNLGGPDGSLSVSAQGYIAVQQSLSLERGPNEVIIVLERDPYGLLPSTACASGETPLYFEDFQNGQSILAHYNDGGAPVPLGPAADEAGNTVLVHDFTTPVGDYSTYLSADPVGGFYEFGDAAWRFRFMMTEETGWGLSWNS
ncbi:MAG: carboxypeptidase regulatory-like domain-containing protein, partial [Chloroflexi bacterium]|nr:carboxypeptidase regulatory-like domain-containing protein [Chloroflexota bacterium]